MSPGRSLRSAFAEEGAVTVRTASGPDGSVPLACGSETFGNTEPSDAGGKQLSRDASLAIGARSRAFRESNLRLLPARLSRLRGSGFGDSFSDMIALQVSGLAELIRCQESRELKVIVVLNLRYFAA